MNELALFESTFFHLNTAGDIAIVDIIRNNLSDDDNLEQLGQDLFAVVDKLQFHKIVLKLSALEYLTSSAIGKFITLHRKLQRHEGSLVLCDLQEGVRQILDTSRLLTYFRSASDVFAAQEALA